MLLKTFQAQFPQLKFKADESLAKHTPVGIGGPAEVFYVAEKIADLVKVLEFCNRKMIVYTVIGWGANTLFADRGIKGLVIQNKTKELAISQTYQDAKITLNEQEKTLKTRWQPPKTQLTNLEPVGSEFKLATVAAGAPLSWVISFLAKQNLVGLEHFTKIPATIGGAIYNNIHGNQYFFSQFLTQVKVFDPKEGVKTLEASQLDFAYDYSRFHQSNEVILEATLKVWLGNSQKASATIAAITQQKINQPVRSLGCVWKNLSEEQQLKLKLPTTSVGYLIDQKLHLSGLRIGDALISPQHAAFIENVGQATAADYLTLMVKVTEEALTQFGVKLEPEIFFKGFEETELAGLNLKSDNR